MSPLCASGPAKKTCHRSARPARRKKQGAAPRGRPSEKKTGRRSASLAQRKKTCHRSARPAQRKKTCHRSGRLPGGRSDWAYRDFPISLAQLATAGRPLAKKKHVTAFPGLWAAGPAKKKQGAAPRAWPSEKKNRAPLRAAGPAKKKHVTAPRGPPREKKHVTALASARAGQKR